MFSAQKTTPFPFFLRNRYGSYLNNRNNSSVLHTYLLLSKVLFRSLITIAYTSSSENPALCPPQSIVPVDLDDTSSSQRISGRLPFSSHVKCSLPSVLVSTSAPFVFRKGPWLIQSTPSREFTCTFTRHFTVLVRPPSTFWFVPWHFWDVWVVRWELVGS